MNKTLRKSTQRGLNALSGSKLKVDGIHGPKTNSVKALFTKKVLKQFADKGYDWEDYNLIGFRTSQIYTNKFTDWMGLFFEGELILFPCSTKPGIGKVKEPPFVDGQAGVAVMVPGQYKKTYKFHDYKGAWTGLPFFLQEKPIWVWRDYNLDNIISKDVKVSDAEYLRKRGTTYQLNLHSWINWNWEVLSIWVGWSNKNWSNITEGCQVAQMKYWHAMLKYFRLMARHYKYEPITYTLLDIW